MSGTDAVSAVTVHWTADDLKRALDAAVEQGRGEGVGAEHEASVAVYNLTVQQRDAAWRDLEAANTRAEQAEAREARLREIVERALPFVGKSAPALWDDLRKQLEALDATDAVPVARELEAGGCREAC